MTIETTTITTPETFQAMVPDGNLLNFQTSDNNVNFLTVNTLFVGANIASTKTRASPLDMWGNVKVPRIEHYEESSQPDSDGWYNANTNYGDLSVYPSFVGIPVAGLDANIMTTDYNVTIDTPYLHLDCRSTNRTEKNSAPPTMPSDGQNVTGNNGLIWWSTNETQSRFRDTIETLRPFNFSYIPAYGPFGILTCAITSVYVESEIVCAVNSTCRATKVRRSRVEHFPSTFTAIDSQWQQWYLVAQGLMSSLGQKKGSGDVNIIDKYLDDPSLPARRWNPYGSDTNPSDKDYSIRFSQLLNSYLTCMYGFYSLTGGITNGTSYFWNKNITFIPPRLSLAQEPSQGFWTQYNFTRDGFKSKIWPAQGWKSEHVEIFVAHRTWAIVLSLASVLLILFSLISPLTHFFLIKGPDVAMNFSSLATRDNPHISIPSNGTFLDAADRFRLLKSMILRFGDADDKSDVGNLVIGSYDVDRPGISNVKKGRLYE